MRTFKLNARLGIFIGYTLILTLGQALTKHLNYKHFSIPRIHDLDTNDFTCDVPFETMFGRNSDSAYVGSH